MPDVPLRHGPDIARAASLIGDPARAAMLAALMDGRALTATELATEAGVTRSTASAHLARLREGGILAEAKQGRARYFRLAAPEVALALEALMGVAARGPARVRPGPKEPALRRARLCYDHLAGEAAVALYDDLVAAGALSQGPEGEPALTRAGAARFAAAGIDVASLARGRRPLCRACLDWSERRSHLAGALGAALWTRIEAQGWARREAARAVRFAPQGEALLRAALAL